MRRWFSGKSDVWRLCQDLAECMDGRTWPDKDRNKVLCNVVHTVLRISFCGLLSLYRTLTPPSTGVHDLRQ